MRPLLHLFFYKQQAITYLSFHIGQCQHHETTGMFTKSLSKNELSAFLN